MAGKAQILLYYPTLNPHGVHRDLGGRIHPGSSGSEAYLRKGK